MHVESVERITKESATEICEGIGFRLPTRAQLAEAQEDPYLAKAVDENSDFGGVKTVAKSSAVSTLCVSGNS